MKTTPELPYIFAKHYSFGKTWGFKGFTFLVQVKLYRSCDSMIVKNRDKNKILFLTIFCST